MTSWKPAAGREARRAVMKPAQPDVLQQLASVPDAEAKEQAWSAFLHAQSDLLLPASWVGIRIG